MRMPELVGCYTGADGQGGLVRLGDGASTTLPSPTWLTRAHGLILAASELDASRITSLRPGPDGPTLVSTVATHGAAGCHLAVSPSGEWMAQAHYTSGSVALLPCPADGHLEEPADLIQFTGHGPDPDRQAGPHAHQVVWLDDGTFLVPDLGTDQVRVLGVRDARLVELGALGLPGGFGPRHLVVRPGAEGGVQMAVAGELSGEVSAWTHPGGDWSSGWVELDRTSGTRLAGSQPSGLRSFGSGLVIANRVVNTLGFLDWTGEGTLELTDELGCEGDHPRDLRVVDGLVWVANQHSDAVSVLRVDGDARARTAEELARYPVVTPACLLF
ncbi:MAG TPA: beta-propeller fold lactonase family protein [Propionibacteriaceae bacterium]|nr:beta-propeller fold lactonase family protein [Propionibacteriaceae bacterium]